MKYSHSAITITFGLIMMSSLMANGYATQMTAFLIPERDRSEPIFTNIRFVTIRFDPQSEISKMFDGVNERVVFSFNSTSPGMSEIIKTINDAILVERNSPVKIEDARIDYTATLRGDSSKLAIAYKVEFIPTISDYILPNNGSAQIIDLDWRSIKINDSLSIPTPENGEISINYPIGVFQAKYPDFANQLLNSTVKSIMTEPLFDFEDIGLPMDRWHFLFDPTGSQASAAGSGYAGDEGARVVSVFSLGESSFREGTHEASESDASATIQNSKITIHASTPPPSGQIQIPGFAKVEKINNAEVAFVTPTAPSGTVTSSGGFPILVLGALAGMMAGVAVLVIFMARKKTT